MPIQHNVEQNSLEWHILRLGMPTASMFSKIITPKKMELSSQADKQISLLIAEKLGGQPLIDLSALEWIQRGKDLEPSAFRAYAMLNDVEPTKSGFWTTDDMRYGASPDAIIGASGIGEIKCPAPQTHVHYLRHGIDTDYRCQMQGQLLVSEKDFCDFFSYHPDYEPVQIRVERDYGFISKLKAVLDEFCETLRVELEKIQAQRITPPIDHSHIKLGREEQYEDYTAAG